MKENKTEKRSVSLCLCNKTIGKNEAIPIHWCRTEILLPFGNDRTVHTSSKLHTHTHKHTNCLISAVGNELRNKLSRESCNN